MEEKHTYDTKWRIEHKYSTFPGINRDHKRRIKIPRFNGIVQNRKRRLRGLIFIHARAKKKKKKDETTLKIHTYTEIWSLNKVSKLWNFRIWLLS